GGWSANVTAWHARAVPTAVVRYEKLVAEPVAKMSAALRAVGVDCAARWHRPLPDFDALHAQWPGMFRRGEPGAWRREMPEDIHRAFWSRHGAAMRLLGYA